MIISGNGTVQISSQSGRRVFSLYTTNKIKNYCPELLLLYCSKPLYGLVHQISFRLAEIRNPELDP
jgi:hypothetical protein